MTCPTLLIHGQADRLIPCTHSQELHARCQKGPSKLVMPPRMTHNALSSLRDDILLPIKDFFVENNIKP